MYKEINCNVIHTATAPAHHVVGLVTPPVRLAVHEELQGEEVGGAADHAPAS